MEALLNGPAVSSQQDIKGLRRFHDCVEAHMRGLKALKVPSQSSPELRLIMTCEMTGESWDLERLMKTFEREVDARECAFIPTSSSNLRRSQPRLPTASTLVANNSGSNIKLTCVYCDIPQAPLQL